MLRWHLAEVFSATWSNTLYAWPGLPAPHTLATAHDQVHMRVFYTSPSKVFYTLLFCKNFPIFNCEPSSLSLSLTYFPKPRPGDQSRNQATPSLRPGDQTSEATPPPRPGAQLLFHNQVDARDQVHDSISASSYLGDQLLPASFSPVQILKMAEWEKKTNAHIL